VCEAVDGRADDDLTRADLRRETTTLRVPEPFCEVGLHRVVVEGGGAAGLELAIQPAIN
jgi:NADPH-dependent 2,4-dienoyl-CoA reductase/sulfur reductase-like enzyme